MQFSLLGPMVVHDDDGVAVPITAARQRTVLAALLLHANRAVSQDQLIEILWDDQAPDSARLSLVNYVARARRALGPVGGARVQTTPAGYLITVHKGELDCLQARDLEQEAYEASRSGDWNRTGRLSRDALALWRGEPFQDVPSAVLLREEAPALAAMRLRIHELGIDADLHVGDYQGAIARLSPLIRLHSLRERFYEQMIVAQYGAGLRAEALETYQQVRRVLRVELGVDPTPALQWLHLQILEAAPVADLVRGLTAGGNGPGVHATQNTTLQNTTPQGKSTQLAAAAEPAVAVTVVTTVTPTGHPGPIVPRQLPGASRHFSGRSRELGQLAGMLDPAGAVGQAAAIAVITGTAGVGKTTLAVHWSWQVADQFHDGQLYLNLRGFDPGGEPVRPGQAIRGLLEALSVPMTRIPASLDAQTGLYRSLMAGKRMLILLDNARDAEQVRPLLPGSPSCLVLVTSRNRLGGLIATEGAQPVVLGLPTDEEALDLLTRRLGPERIAREEPAAVDGLIRMCARLPLALAVAAGRLGMNPDFPFDALTERLRGTDLRLAALEDGDGATSIRAVLSWSYQQLGAPAARTFRLLGLHPGPDFSLSAVASLAGLAPEQARSALDELVGAQLVNEQAPGRFAFHDLLRVYAGELVTTLDDAAERHEATARMLDYYLHASYAAATKFVTYRDVPALAEARAGVVVDDDQVADYAKAAAWFAAEQQVLVAVTALAAEAGFDTHTTQIASAAADFLSVYGRWHDVRSAQQHALTAALRLGDLKAQAAVHRSIGHAAYRLGWEEEAITHIQQALDLHAELGSATGQASSLGTLALILDGQGRHQEALELSKRGLECYRQAGHRAGEAAALTSIGWIVAELGDYEAALDYCGQSLALSRELGNRHTESSVWGTSGYAHWHLGDYEQAVSCYQQAIELCREFGDNQHLADALTYLGDVHLAAGDADAARESWKEALVIREATDHSGAQELRTRLSG